MSEQLMARRKPCQKTKLLVFVSFVGNDARASHHGLAATAARSREAGYIHASCRLEPHPNPVASGGVLSRHQTEPGSEIPRFPELAVVTDSGNQRRRADRPDAGDHHEPTGSVMFCCEYFNLSGNGCESDIDDLQLLPKLFEQSPYRGRQIVGLIRDDARDVEFEKIGHGCPFIAEPAPLVGEIAQTNAQLGIGWPCRGQAQRPLVTPRAANGSVPATGNGPPARPSSPSHRADMEMPTRDIRFYRRYLAPIRHSPERSRWAANAFLLDNSQLKAPSDALIQRKATIGRGLLDDTTSSIIGECSRSPPIWPAASA